MTNCAICKTTEMVQLSYDNICQDCLGLLKQVTRKQYAAQIIFVSGRTWDNGEFSSPEEFLGHLILKYQDSIVDQRLLNISIVQSDKIVETDYVKPLVCFNIPGMVK